MHIRLPLGNMSWIIQIMNPSALKNPDHEVGTDHTDHLSEVWIHPIQSWKTRSIWPMCELQYRELRRATSTYRCSLIFPIWLQMQTWSSSHYDYNKESVSDANVCLANRTENGSFRVQFARRLQVGDGGKPVVCEPPAPQARDHHICLPE